MTTRKRRASKPGAKQKQKEAVPGVRRQDALAFINDRGKSIKVRLPLAVRMMTGSAYADGRAALESMLAEKGVTAEQESRIFRAIERAESAMTKAQRRSLPQPRRDVSGPLTIGIVLDPELHERWKEAHSEEPEVKWERRLFAVPHEMLRLIGRNELDEMHALPAKDRLARLDLLLSKALRRG